MDGIAGLIVTLAVLWALVLLCYGLLLWACEE